MGGFPFFGRGRGFDGCGGCGGGCGGFGGFGGCGFDGGWGGCGGGCGREREASCITAVRACRIEDEGRRGWW